MPPQRRGGAIDRAKSVESKKAAPGIVGMMQRAGEYEERAGKLYAAIEDQLPRLDRVADLLERLVVALEKE